MLSKEGAQKFAELTYTLTIVDGAHDDQQLDSVLVSSLELVKAAQEVERIESPKYGTWYRPLQEDVEAAMGTLLTGKLDVRGFLERVQKKADQVKKDPKIKKFTR